MSSPILVLNLNHQVRSTLIFWCWIILLLTKNISLGIVPVVVAVDNQASGCKPGTKVIGNSAKNIACLVNADVRWLAFRSGVDRFKELHDVGAGLQLGKQAPGNHHTTWSTQSLNTIVSRGEYFTVPPIPLKSPMGVLPILIEVLWESYGSHISSKMCKNHR
jgi:hypothetical protein